MSGPKVIDYRAIERERAEAARRRWRSLAGRASALERRCAAAGHPDCAVAVGELAGESEAMQRQCDRLEQAIARAADELARRRLTERTQQVMAGMQDVLADLHRREQAMREAVAAPVQHAAAPVRVDYAGKIGAQLATLSTASPELEDAARQVLATADPARARILYTDLAGRIEEINRRAALAEEQRTAVAELGAHLSDLPDPDPVQVLLAGAAARIERGDDVKTLLEQARDAIERQLDRVAAQSDQEFVRRAVVESLSELGYEVLDVDVETPETLVVRQSGTHGLRADVREGEIDLRAVRLGAADAVADRDAEEEFCRRVPGLLNAMSRRGLTAGVKEQKLPGLYPPETISLRHKRIQSSPQHERQQSLVHKRTTH